MRPPDLHEIWLVTRREFLTRARSRFFLAGTVVLVVLLSGYILVQSLLLGRPTTVSIGFAGDAQVLASPVSQVKPADLTFETHLLSDVAAGQAQVRSGKLDVLISGDPAGPDVYVKDSLNPTLEATLTALVKQVALNRALTQAGADPAKVETQVAQANIRLDYLDPNADQQTQRAVVGVFVAAILYVALVVYGQIIAAGVVEEKQNRIIEILLSTVRPSQLLFGKVLGIGALGLIQLVILGVVALTVSSKFSVLNVPTVGAPAVLGGVLWFVLGFVLYALFYATAGSLVSRQEDLGSVVTPLTMLVVGTYLAFFWMIANPDNPAGIALSIIPPFAPILMPARMAAGEAQAWQVVLAVALTIVAIVGVTSLASRIYANSVLRVGSRVKLLEAWRGRA